MDSDKKPLLDGVLKLLNICGVNPLNDNLFAKIKSFLSMIIIFFYFNEMFFGAISYGDVEHILFGVPASMGLELFTFKFITLIGNRNELKNLIINIKTKYWKTDRYGNELHENIQNIYKKLRKILITIAVMYLVTTYSLFINPPLIKSRTQPYALYHVTKTHAPLKEYLISYFLQLIVLTVMGISVYISFYFIFVVLIVFNINELKIIKEGFLSTSNKPGEDLDEIKALIDHHNLVLGSIKKVNDIFFPFMTNVLLNTVLITCLSLINIITKPFPPHVTSVCLIILFLSMLFVFCFLGTLLSNESESVAHAIYQCNWWKKNKTELRKKLVLVMLRSQKPVTLRAANLNLEFPTFTAVIKVSFNFFTFTRALLTKTDDK